MRENLVESFFILSKKSILSWTQGGERKFQMICKTILTPFNLPCWNPFTKNLFRIALGIKECQYWIHIKMLYLSNSLHKSWNAILNRTRISLKLSKTFVIDKFLSVLSNKAVQNIGKLNDFESYNLPNKVKLYCIFKTTAVQSIQGLNNMWCFGWRNCYPKLPTTPKIPKEIGFALRNYSKDESLHAYFGISLQGEAINNKDVTSPQR